MLCSHFLNGDRPPLTKNEGVVLSGPDIRRHLMLSAGETVIDHLSEFPEDERDHF